MIKPTADLEQAPGSRPSAGTCDGVPPRLRDGGPVGTIEDLEDRSEREVNKIECVKDCAGEETKGAEDRVGEEMKDIEDPEDRTRGELEETGHREDGAREEVEVLEDLADRILELAAHLNAGNQRLLVLIAEFDEKGGWERAGHRSCAHWLAFNTGADMGTAREQVRVARALRELPLTSAAMARGELSFAAVQELTRVATVESEADLVEYARSCTVAELRRLIRSWRRFGRREEAELERMLHASRRFSVVPDGEGMYVVRGRLTPEVGAVLMRAVEAASDALFRPGDGVEPEQRRADAVGLLAERALAAGFGGGVEGEGERGEESEERIGCGCVSEGREDATAPDRDAAGTGVGPGHGAARPRGAREAARQAQSGDAAAPAPIDDRAAEVRIESGAAKARIDSGAGETDSGERAAESGSSDGAAEAGSGDGAAETGSGDGAAETGIGGRATKARIEHPPTEDRAPRAAAGAGSSNGAAEAFARPNPPASSCCGHDRRIPLSGTRAERYQVVIHVEPETLREQVEGGRSELEDGTRLSAETARRFACDASILHVVRDRDGSVLDVGRKTRTIPPALRRALEIRDRGCRFPGCGLRFTEAHHIEHWQDGGATSLTNCILICRYHHRLLHEERFSLRVIRGQYVFLDRDGMPVPDRPPRRNGGKDPLGRLLRENRRRGVEPTYRTCTPRYRRSEEIPLHVLLRAMEAAAGESREERVSRGLAREAPS